MMHSGRCSLGQLEHRTADPCQYFCWKDLVLIMPEVPLTGAFMVWRAHAVPLGTALIIAVVRALALSFVPNERRQCLVETALTFPLVYSAVTSWGEGGGQAVGSHLSKVYTQAGEKPETVMRYRRELVLAARLAWRQCWPVGKISGSSRVTQRGHCTLVLPLLMAKQNTAPACERAVCLPAIAM